MLMHRVGQVGPRSSARVHESPDARLVRLDELRVSWGLGTRALESLDDQARQIGAVRHRASLMHRSIRREAREHGADVLALVQEDGAIGLLVAVYAEQV